MLFRCLCIIALLSLGFHCSGRAQEVTNFQPELIELASASELIENGIDPLTIEVLWCSEDASFKDANYLQSLRYAYHLSGAATILGEEYGAQISTVRIREMPTEYAVSFNLTYASEAIVVPKPEQFNSELSGEFVLAEAMRESLPFGDVGQIEFRNIPKGNIIVYICSDPTKNTASMLGRSALMHLHVTSGRSDEAAKRLRNAVQRTFRTVDVAHGIEIVNEELSPNNSQIRYFYAGDKRLAEDVARKASEELGVDFVPQYIPGYGETVAHGHLEGWFGTSFPADPDN